jgi:hypothetical protein
MSDRPSRILIITDRTDISPELHQLIRDRAARGPVTVTFLVTNPARAEYHVLHPERHARIAQTQSELEQALAAVRADVQVEMQGTVSIRHDPFEAVEEYLLESSADEVVVNASSNELSRRLHHDLPHRLEHLRVPVTVLNALASEH